MTDLTSRAREAAEDRIREMDRALAPGSQTSLLGDALEGLRTATDIGEALAWWEGAYRRLEWAIDHPDLWASDAGVWDSPEEEITLSGDDWTGWTA